MTRPVNLWCCRIVELATRMLPAGQRQRYALEFIAELYEMPRMHQVRHAFQILTHAWAFRTALLATSPAGSPEIVSPSRTRRPFRCLLRVHRWRWASAEDGGRYQTCVRCGRDKTESVPGLPGKSMIGM